MLLQYNGYLEKCSPFQFSRYEISTKHQTFLHIFHMIGIKLPIQGLKQREIPHLILNLGHNDQKIKIFSYNF